MDCIAKILTSVYNSETKKTEMLPIDIGKIDSNENLTLDKVVEFISTLPISTRKELSSNIITARKQTLTSKMIKNHQFVGNTTIADILSKYPALADTYTINPSLYDKYNIIQCSDFTINNISYNGRVLAANGQELFIIKDAQGATNFIKYLQAKETIEKIFNSTESLPESITPYLDTLKVIAKKYNKSVKDTLLDYLNYRDSMSPFIFQGKTITSRQVIGKVIQELTHEYKSDSNLTDFEIGVSSIKTNKKGYDWKVSKESLYNTILLYFPKFDEQLSLEDFLKLSDEELDILFTGPNGLFVGNPKLERAKVKRTTTGSQTIIQPKEATTKKIGKVSNSELKKAWDSVYQQAEKEGVKLPKNFTEIAKQNPEGIAQLFNTAKFLYTDTVDGHPRTIQARVTEDKNGNKKVVFSYEYEVVNSPKVKKSASYITLTFPYSLIGDIYNFGYKTQSIFSPVTDGSVVNGRYNGMYIYKATIPTRRGNQEVYAISRSIISPNSYMRTFPTLEAAIEGVNKQSSKDTIDKNSLISIKQSLDAPRKSVIEMDSLHEGQILTTLDIELPKIALQNLPWSIKQMMSLTVPEFQQRLYSVTNIQKINTPEKAAAFLLLVFNKLKQSDFNEINKSKSVDFLTDLLSNNYSTVIDSIINYIDTAPTKNYYIEKLITSKNVEHGEKHKIATLKLLENGGTTVDISGTKVGDITVDEFIGQTLTGAIDFFKKQYDVDVVSMTSSELLDYSNKNNLNLEKKIDAIKAFIHNGTVYINTTNAKTSDLFHEISHIFLGILKVRYPEGYQQIIQEYQGKKGAYKKKINWVETNYSEFAMQDKIEEAVVDMIADEMFKDNKLSIGFNSDRFTEIMQNIINKVDEFKQDMMDSGLGFNAFMKVLMNENAEKMKKQRIITNFIKSKLGNEIIENCK